MLKDVIDVHPLDNYRLHLRFEDGIEGILDLPRFIECTGVFAPLKDPAFFAQVCVHKELGGIHWPNDADLDSDVLYAHVTGKPIPGYKQGPASHASTSR